VLAAALLAACGGKASAPPSPTAASYTPAWENALPRDGELFARMRVAELMRDERLKGLVEPMRKTALARADASIAITPVLDRCDELVVASRDGEMVIALVGVRADTGPDVIKDRRGDDALHEVGHPEHITEWQTERGEASLFVMPGRVWVIAAGPQRGRVRRALLSPAPSTLEPSEYLAEMRLRGDQLVRQIPGLGAGQLADVGSHLSTMHVSVRSKQAIPIADGGVERAGDRLVVRLDYDQPLDRERAERVLAHVRELARETGKLGWFAPVDIRGESRTITLVWSFDR
jgi:hypothetical protein